MYVGWYLLASSRIIRSIALGATATTTATATPTTAATTVVRESIDSGMSLIVKFLGSEQQHPLEYVVWCLLTVFTPATNRSTHVYNTTSDSGSSETEKRNVQQIMVVVRLLFLCLLAYFAALLSLLLSLLLLPSSLR